MLHYATKDGSLQLCTFLLSNGANVLVLDKHKRTPLHVATRRKNLEHIAKLLVTKSGKKARYSGDRDGYTPLHNACEAGALDVANAIIDHNLVDVNAKSKTGATAAFRATTKGELGILRALVNAGADVNLADGDGLTPLYQAVYQIINPSQYYTSDITVVSFLCDAGANKHKQTHEGVSAQSLVDESDNEALKRLFRSNQDSGR